jgi:hypothetical protein
MTTTALGVVLPTIGGDTDTYAPKIEAAIVANADEHVTKTVNIDCDDKEYKAPLIRDYAEKGTANATATGSVTLDYSASNHHFLTLTGNVTSLTISNPPASDNLAILTIWIKQDGTGSRTFAFPSSFKWEGGASAPAVSTTASVTDIVTAVSKDGGSTWAASISQGRTGL